MFHIRPCAVLTSRWFTLHSSDIFLKLFISGISHCSSCLSVEFYRNLRIPVERKHKTSPYPCHMITSGVSFSRIRLVLPGWTLCLFCVTFLYLFRSILVSCTSLRMTSSSSPSDLMYACYTFYCSRQDFCISLHWERFIFYFKKVFLFHYWETLNVGTFWCLWAPNFKFISMYLSLTDADVLFFSFVFHSVFYKLDSTLMCITGISPLIFSVIFFQIIAFLIVPLKDFVRIDWDFFLCC